MAYDRQWVIDFLQRLGFSREADAAAQELPETASREEVIAFGDRHGISVDELTSRMGGSP